MPSCAVTGCHFGLAGHVPMMAAETEGRPGKGEDGKARTREVKLACAFTQTRFRE